MQKVKSSDMPAINKKSVFISGSAYEYGSFGEAGKTFIRGLSKALVKNDFKIFSGFGLGVGHYVIDGALDEIYLEKKEKLTDHIWVFPFPSLDQPEIIRQHYRHDMISQADTAIFLFGNKLEDIAVREADGMMMEFEIACHYHSLLIPVGASGYAAEKLWKRVMGQYNNYFDNRDKFKLYERLGDSSLLPEELIELILQIAL
jgi:hypothetical protein